MMRKIFVQNMMKLEVIEMSWENELKKAKFQGPQREHARFQADEMYLGMALREIHSYVKKGMEFLEKAKSEYADGNQDIMRQNFLMEQARNELEYAMEEIDKIDEEMLERAKYVGRKKQTYKFDERIDEDDLDYEGAKYPRDR